MSKPIVPDDLAALRAIVADHDRLDLNEADTRHRIIDVILNNVLKWPRNRVDTERYVQPGFADYILTKSNQDDLLFVEAKKEGFYFDIVLPFKEEETHCYFPIGRLLGDANTKSAMMQVRNYCFDTGFEFACVTNGRQWIFFKTFEKGKRWENLNAFVVRNLEFFLASNNIAYNSFSFQAITANSSLGSILSSASPKDRNIYYPKEKIYAYSRTIAANRLAPILRPVITYYFGVIGDEDTEFMERCYASQIEYGNASEGMTTIIQDCLSPYLEAYGVKQLDNTGKGGRLGGKLTKNLKKRRLGEVLVLFGGKGAGKSTFLKRLLFHKPPRWLLQHAVIAIVDLLRTPEDRQVIRFKVWNDLIKSLDVDKLLKVDRAILTQGLFADRFETALKQELSGLDAASETYNLRLNELVAAWKQDLLYCAVRLVDYLGLKDKGVIIVVDNTDQYSSSTQDFCFSAAQEISDKLGCITLISMREERFHDSKIHGLLDAFQNSGFHISSPKPTDVFRKRLQYLTSLLSNSRRRHLLVGDAPADVVADCITYLSILTKEFGTEKSPLNNFLTACAHGDIRLSLDLFRSFLLSGYTNVDEMISKGSWIFKYIRS